ncbi:MAG: DsrE family protein, partial [Bacteroidota bacterium]
RMAMTIQKEDEASEVRVFLMADAATAALPNQNTPQGYYNIERMIRSVILKGGKVKICGSCAEARGIKELKLIDGTELSTMKELVKWTLDSDTTLTF